MKKMHLVSRLFDLDHKAQYSESTANLVSVFQKLNPSMIFTLFRYHYPNDSGPSQSEINVWKALQSALPNCQMDIQFNGQQFANLTQFKEYLGIMISSGINPDGCSFDFLTNAYQAKPNMINNILAYIHSLNKYVACCIELPAFVPPSVDYVFLNDYNTQNDMGTISKINGFNGKFLIWLNNNPQSQNSGGCTFITGTTAQRKSSITSGYNLAESLGAKYLFPVWFPECNSYATYDASTDDDMLDFYLNTVNPVVTMKGTGFGTRAFRWRVDGQTQPSDITSSLGQFPSKFFDCAPRMFSLQDAVPSDYSNWIKIANATLPLLRTYGKDYSISLRIDWPWASNSGNNPGAAIQIAQAAYDNFMGKIAIPQKVVSWDQAESGIPVPVLQQVTAGCLKGNRFNKVLWGASGNKYAFGIPGVVAASIGINPSNLSYYNDPMAYINQGYISVISHVDEPDMMGHFLQFHPTLAKQKAAWQTIFTSQQISSNVFIPCYVPIKQGGTNTDFSYDSIQGVAYYNGVRYDFPTLPFWSSLLQANNP